MKQGGLCNSSQLARTELIQVLDGNAAFMSRVVKIDQVLAQNCPHQFVSVFCLSDHFGTGGLFFGRWIFFDQVWNTCSLFSLHGCLLSVGLSLLQVAQGDIVHGMQDLVKETLQLRFCQCQFSDHQGCNTSPFIQRRTHNLLELNECCFFPLDQQSFKVIFIWLCLCLFPYLYTQL